MADDKLRILVVDDNPAGRYATSHVLRSAGYEVAEAATGGDALEKVAQEDFALVVLDVNLPDIDGFEVCRRIRSNEKSSRIPVVHLSATFVKDVDKVHGLEAGADGYLVHPVEPPVLLATIQAFLRARHAEEDRERLLVSERAARADAERANRVKDDFLATLSHELRTPLQAIIGWAKLLKMGGLSPGDVDEGVSVIERNAMAQSQMIADLLDVSRIISGKLRLDVQPIDPAAMVDAAVLAIMPAAEAKNIRIAKVLDYSTGLVQGDPDRLQQVVWNLVNNAVKFTPKGGRIEVVLRRVNSHVELSVSDNGPGIDEDLLPRIFDRFHQGDSSTTRHHGGLGLGLAIARQLVELHGGHITAASAGSGKGASFAVSLPISLSQQPAPRDAAELEPASHELVNLAEIKVLLVDDDADSRQMLVRILHRCGAVTQQASNMSAALADIASFAPQVLLSDLGMPGHDGYELIRKIRASGLTPDRLPAIALTGFARSEDRQRALLAGFQMHMSKPVDPRELTAAIAMLARRV